MGTKRVGMARVRSLINENTNQLKLNRQKQITLVHNVTTNHTLGADASGATLLWEHGSAHDITLPSAKAGMTLKFILKVGSAHAQNLVSQSSDKIYGKVIVHRSDAADKTSLQTVARGSAVDKIKLHKTTTTNLPQHFFTKCQAILSNPLFTYRIDVLIGNIVKWERV